MTHDVTQQTQADRDLAEAARALRRGLEADLAEAHRQDPRRAAPLDAEARQAPRDWRDVEILRLRAELDAVGTEHEAVLAQLREAGALAERLAAELQAVRASTSWRLTAPVRIALDRARGRRSEG